MGKVRYKEDHANKGKVSKEVIWQEYIQLHVFFLVLHDYLWIYKIISYIVHSRSSFFKERNDRVILDGSWQTPKKFFDMCSFFMHII